MLLQQYWNDVILLDQSRADCVGEDQYTKNAPVCNLQLLYEKVGILVVSGTNHWILVSLRGLMTTRHLF